MELHNQRMVWNFLLEVSEVRLSLLEPFAKGSSRDETTLESHARQLRHSPVGKQETRPRTFVTSLLPFRAHS